MVMKKILLFLLLISTQTFAQQKWSSPKKAQCYGGIYISAVNYGKQAPGYLWGLKFTNKYSKPVLFRYRLTVGGESYPSGLAYWINPGASHIDGGELVTGLLFKNGSTTYNIEVYEVCFDKDGGCYNKCFAECDNGSPNQPNCGGKGTSNSNANNSNSQSGGNAQARLDELNGYLIQLPENDSEGQSIYSGAERVTGTATFSDQQKAEMLKPFIERAKKRVSQLENQTSTTSKSNSSRLSAEQKRVADEETQQQKAQEQARKAYESKASRINDYMQKGESALSAGKYDEAIANFSQAGNICSDDPQFQQQRNEALQARARAEKAKADAARKVRIEERQKQEAATNTAVAGAATATVGLMALLNDDYTDKPFAARAQIGLGAESMTMSVVENNSREETVQSPVTANFLLGLNLTFFNNKGIQLHLNPYLDYGIVALQEGYQGSSIKYGGNAMLQLGLKNENLFKLFVEGGYAQRSGNMNYDRDVANGGTSATDYLTKGSFDYSVIRYGGGIMLHGEADTGEVRIKPGIFFEEFSFAKGQRVMSFNLHANIMSQIVIEFTYSKNYVVPGGVINPSAFKAEDKDFWGFKIIRQGLLTGK
jgi:hypothetical protein